MQTQISINPADFSLIEEIAINYNVNTKPVKGERIFIDDKSIDELKDKINKMQPYPLWDKIKELLLEDEDSTCFGMRYYLIEDIIHFQDKIIYVIGDGFWADAI